MANIKSKNHASSWTIVQFVNDNNSVEAVPTIWISEKSKCFWPLYDPGRIVKAIKHCEPPIPGEKKWQLHFIKTFRNATYNDYKTARLKCEKAEYTSDLGSDTNNNKKRKRQIKQKSFSSSESEIEDHGSNALKEKKNISKRAKLEKLPVLPEILLPDEASYNTNTTISSSIDSTLDKSLEKDDNLNNSKLNSNASETDADNNVAHQTINQDLDLPAQLDQTIDKNKTIRNKNNLRRKNKFRNNNEQEKITGYFKKIIRKLNNIEMEINDLKINQMKGTKKLLNNDDDYTKVWAKFDLPLIDEEQLQRFEVFLNKEENMEKSIKMLVHLGGSSEEDFVRRAMKKLVADEIQQYFSWAGQKTKKSFSSLLTYQLIMKSAMQSLCDGNPKEKALENAFKNYLKRAPERLRKNKKRN